MNSERQHTHATLIAIGRSCVAAPSRAAPRSWPSAWCWRAVGPLSDCRCLSPEVLTTGVDTPGDGRYAFGFDDHTTNGICGFWSWRRRAAMNDELEICPTAVLWPGAESNCRQADFHKNGAPSVPMSPLPSQWMGRPETLPRDSRNRGPPLLEPAPRRVTRRRHRTPPPTMTRANPQSPSTPPRARTVGGRGARW